MRSTAGNWLAIAAALAMAACGDGATDPSGGGGNGGGGNGGGGGATPAAVSVVSGNGQIGRTLEALGQALVVRVTDAGGTAVSGASVSWSVASGGGTLSASSSSTNSQGQASVMFTPGATLGSSTIRATVAGVSQAAEFTVETTIALVRMQNTAFVSPQGGDDLSVPVGTTVEWVNRDGVSHTATSTAEPAGGAPFDSGVMGNNDRFQFTPQVEGTWTYFCEVHPGIMVGATITATAAGG